MSCAWWSAYPATKENITNQTMSRDTNMQQMTPLAPLVDQLQEIARTKLPAPRSCRIQLWDDGDYDITISHSQGEDEGQAISYDVDTGDVLWKYRKNGEWVVDGEAETDDRDGTPYTRTFEKSETQRITTIEPPVTR